VVEEFAERSKAEGGAALDAEVEIETRPDGTMRVAAPTGRALEVLRRLRDDPETAMQRLVDLTAIDREGSQERFEVVYRLHSPSHNRTAFVHVRLASDEPVVDSVTTLWPAANWLEREVFDLFGIRFCGHPDLRRILLEAEFEGAPLRKDYPKQPRLPLPRGEGL
jgi:NADH/F420H2 dehydrogenase subunit C